MQTTLAQLSKPEREKIRDFLEAHPVGVLATVDTAGNPYASTIYIAVDHELHITFTTKRETAKYKNLMHNNRVMLVVYEAASQTAVQIGGRAVEVTDSEIEQQIYMGTLQAAERTGEDVVPPIAKIAAGPYVGFTIQIDTVHLSEYGWGNNFANALRQAGSPQSSGDPA